ncbi:MAG: hypothetical protein HY805_10015 [Nitrospirae bacterium]|nr:hypothetical protein [Nitrospirota bacterium]
MLVLIKSAPDTADGKRAVKLARDMAGDLVLMQNAVYFAEKERLEGFCGTIYALDEDILLRGITETEKGIKTLSYDELIEIMAENNKVVGAF